MKPRQWLWRADADGGAHNEEPHDGERRDENPSDVEQWGENDGTAAEGMPTANQEFEANRFDMVRPITQERLGLLFDGEGWAWRIDADGDLCGFWEGYIFCFRFLGDTLEVLSIVALMHQAIMEEREEELRDFLQRWHSEFLWPKAYYESGKDGLHVVAEVNMDYEYGATDAQLVQQVMCALATTLQLFHALARHFGLDEDSGSAQRGFGDPTWLPPGRS